RARHRREEATGQRPTECMTMRPNLSTPDWTPTWSPWSSINLAQSGKNSCRREEEIVDALHSISQRKTRLANRRQRQAVTGLTVNARPNVRRRYVRNLRAALHQLRLGAGRRSGASPAVGAQPNDIVRGRLAFLKMVRGADDPMYVRYGLEF